ncbi:MAG: ABC transporter ATP-binding protein/permease [Dysgonamonadaceae bacterium]|jgi:subfamily B ATP-binding cassette protein MsbA|nr:ABC transporter ATP-binding protein/permease [Dysgonamonadaceae bacterium]
MKNSEEIKREIAALKFVWKMAKGEHSKIVSVTVLNIFAGIFPAAVAWVLKNYMDIYSLNINRLLNFRDILLFFALMLAGIFLKTFSALIMGYTMPNIKRNIEIACIRKFSQLPGSYISDCIDNRVVMTLSMESSMITSLLPMVYRSFIKAPVTVIAFILLLMLVSPTLTLAGLILISTIVAGITLFRSKIKHLNKISYDRIGDLHQYFVDWLRGFRIFTVSGATGYVERRLGGVSTELADLRKKTAKLNALQTLIVETMTVAVTIFFVFMASREILTSQRLNIAELVLFPAAILFIRSEIMNIINGYMQLATTESSARRIMDVINYPLAEESGKTRFEEPVETLSINEVSFFYGEDGKKVLDSANALFKRGRINTVIGRSGSGKTTLINLCMGLRQPQSGNIFYNSRNINDISEESLTAKIGLVEQEPFVFAGTLAENLFFDREADVQHVLSLLRDFGLSYLAENEQQLKELKIGKNGRQLSTGEKQRLALIRALIRNVEVIFFDEVTGNLDAENARTIIDCIRKVSRDCLVVCVTHDKMLINESDSLFEIIRGKIVCTKE